MKQIYLKFSMLLLCLVASMSAWAADPKEELYFSSSSNKITIVQEGAAEPGGDVKVTQGIITVSSAGGQIQSGKALQIYKTKSMTISVPEAYVITNIDITYPTNCYPFSEAIPSGLENATTKTATGSTSATYTPTTPASSFTFTNIAGGQTKINKLVITYKQVGEIVNVTGVTIDKTSANVNVGNTLTLTANVAPTNATDKTIIWSSSDQKVATVSGAGLVKGVGKGTATITAKTKDGEFTASCEVTVNKIDATGISLNKTSISLENDLIETLTATILPEDASIQKITWTSSDESVATVTNGQITAIGVGTATITATAEDGGFTATCEVKVTKAEEPDEYLFLFAANGEDSDNGTAWKNTTELNKVFAEGYQYISSITATNNVYPARNTLVNGVKFGSSSVAGSISFNLKKPVPATYIVVSAAPYGDAEGQQGFTINGQKVEMPHGQNKVYNEYAIKLDGSDLSTITLSQNAANKGRIYVESIKLIKEDTYYASCSRKLTAKDAGAYYATFSSDKVTFFPEDYIVSAVGVENGQLYQFDNEEAFDEDIVEINGEDVIGFYVPANTGVLITSEENTINYYTVDGVTPSNDVEAVNMLRPASADMTGDYKFYKLAYDDYTAKTGLGFYYGTDEGAAFTCKAGLAYLAVPTASAAKSFVLGDAATAIQNVNNTSSSSAIYNLNGQRLSQLQKGINIVNGKKLFVK